MRRIKTPHLYATGRYRVELPFRVNHEKIYVCHAISSFESLRADNIDPYETYYKPFDIPRNRYEEDAQALGNIVTLICQSEPIVHIPDSFILQYPDVTSIAYQYMILSVSLGAVPDTLTLDDVKFKMQDLVLNSLGIDCQIKVHTANEASEYVDQLTHKTLERNRLAKVQNNETHWAMLLKAREENRKLRDHLDLLEQLIIDHELLDIVYERQQESPTENILDN